MIRSPEVKMRSIFYSRQRNLDLLGGQRVNVPDLPGHSHGVAIDDIEVLFSKKQQTLTGVQTLNPGTAVHVLDLNNEHNKRVLKTKVNEKSQNFKQPTICEG